MLSILTQQYHTISPVWSQSPQSLHTFQIEIQKQYKYNTNTRQIQIQIQDKYKYKTNTNTNLLYLLSRNLSNLTSLLSSVLALSRFSCVESWVISDSSRSMIIILRMTMKVAMRMKMKMRMRMRRSRLKKRWEERLVAAQETSDEVAGHNSQT